MRTVFVLLFLVLSPLPIFAGNLLPILQLGQGGLWHEYKFTENPEVLFDRDISRELQERVITKLNDKLKDIQLVKTHSEIDFDHAIDVADIWREPNRFFVHNGRGWNPSGFNAYLRGFENDGGTCLVTLSKDQFDGFTFETQALIIEHELMHCLRWAHSFMNSNINAYENLEPLLRLYDSANKQNAVVVEIKKRQPKDQVLFTNRKNPQWNVGTYDNQIKLHRGVYNVYLNGKFVDRIKFVKNRVLRFW